MIDTYPDTFAVVEYRVLDGYQEPWGTDRGRYFYDIWSSTVPFFTYNGLGDVGEIDVYVDKFIAFQAVPTPITMSVGAETIFAGTYRITIRARKEPGTNSLDLRTYAVIVEDHYPTSASYYRNAFRAATSTTDFTLPHGGCHVDMHEITVVPATVESNFKVIAWAQTREEHSPAKVYQAAKDVWPFDPLPAVGDFDNGADVDIDDFVEFTYCMRGPDPTILPRWTCRHAFDSDGDNDVDSEDFAAFTHEFAGS